MLSAVGPLGRLQAAAGSDKVRGPSTRDRSRSLAICGWIETVRVFGAFWNPGPLAIPFTVFWLVACVNIVNLLDGHDGLASTIGLIAVGTMAVLSGMIGGVELAVLCLIAGGAIAGFLIHNWPPAKIFLGDAGSMTIGFLIGALSMESSLKSAATFTLITPLAVLCVPMFDTVMAIVRRKLSGRSIGAADRGHIHHRLQDSGFSRLQTLLVISGLCPDHGDCGDHCQLARAGFG